MPPEAVTPIAPPPSRAQPPPQRELRPHPTQPIKVDDSDSDSDTIARDKNNWYQRLLQVIFLGCAVILVAVQPLIIVIVVYVLLLLCCCSLFNFYNRSFDLES